MRRIRLYSDQALRADAPVELQGPAAHHLLRVLRRRAGDEVTLFNGDGREHDGRITEIPGRDRCLIELTRHREPGTESPLDLTLIQAVGRGDRMDWALQKSVEVGVTRIQPVLSERTEVRLSGARADKRMAHWHSVIVAACEQSGRVRIPPLQPLCSVSDIPAEDGTNRFLDPDAEETVDRLAIPADHAIRLAIGPEGGFSDRDLKALGQLGFTGLRLGPRVLRTETAGPAVIAILQARWGDMGSEQRR